MAPALLTIEHARLSFGGEALLDDASLVIGPQARTALVGRNGSGKSTLLKLAAGLIEADEFERFIDPSATVAYLPQEPSLSGYETIGAFVDAGLPPTGATTALARL